jgi:hypothetical protein
MKKALLFFMLLSVAAQAQNWPPPRPDEGRWLYVRAQKVDERNLSVKVYGGVSMGELDTLYLFSITSGYHGYGYYSFTGEKITDPNNPLTGIWDWPPGLLMEEWQYPNARNAYTYTFEEHSGFCNCDCSGGLDTLFWLEGFGFWWLNPLGPESFWGINEGYVVGRAYMNIRQLAPCPPAPPWYGKDPLFFTDSLYRELPDNAVVSGQSNLYLKAKTDIAPASLELTLSIDSQTGLTRSFYMVYDDTMEEWHLKAPPACSLGLKSYANVKAFTHHPGTDSTWDADELTVALPKIFTMVDTTLTDTVFIRSDSMKVAKDLKVGLTFVGDNTSMLVDPTAGSLVACAGYKYKSKWTANENLPSLDSTYYRQYPRDSLAYLWWNDSTAKCLTTFKRDSLSVVGGKLTILSKGLLKEIVDMPEIYNIDNSFLVTSDTFSTANHDSINTKWVLINEDPPNSSFLDSLQTNILKATAWKEGAGNISYGGHSAQTKLNHYWNDTKTPCENGSSTATGTMQIMRSSWERLFSGQITGPPGFDTCSWDSLAWNWNINVHNGVYIYTVNNYYYINQALNPQHLWPSYYYPENDYTPDLRNKEDLSSYGYKVGAPIMMKIETLSDWVTKVKNKSDIVDTRKYKHERPWE